MFIYLFMWIVAIVTFTDSVAVNNGSDLRSSLKKIRSQDFLNLLNVELSIGGDSWENQLQPALKFVQDIQEESTYLDWLKYFARIVSASTGVDLKDIEAAESGSNPLNYLTFLIQHLLTDDNIQKAVNKLASGDELNLPDVPEDFLARLKPTKDKNLGRFSKRLYNAKRKQSKSVVPQPVTSQTPFFNVDQVSAPNSKLDIEAIRAVLVDIIKELKVSSTTDISSNEASKATSIARIETTQRLVPTLASTMSTTTTTTSTTTTTEVLTTTLSIEERIAAFSAKFSGIATTETPSTGEILKLSFAKKFKSTLKPNLPKTTTAYEKYPVFSTTATTIESSETTIPTATLKPEVFTTLPSSESDVWAQSDVSVCQEHRSCIFRGIVFVLGFEATAGRDWNETSARLTKTFSKVLHMIFDLNLGPIQNDLSVRNVVRTSPTSAEIVFELKLIESEFSIDSSRLLWIMNRAESSQFFPFDIDRSLTKFQLVNPDARQADMLTPSPYVDSSGLSPIILSSVMAILLIGGPLIIWSTHLVIRRLRAKNLKRRLIDSTPLVYSELEAAITSLKSNNLYSSTGKKATLSRTSMFDAEREKEQIYKEYMKLEAQREEDYRTGVDRPLPPVPAISMSDSPTTSSSKRSKGASKWLAEKKNVTFAATDDVDADQSDDDLSVYSPRLPSPKSPSFRRRRSSVYRASFRQFISSIRMRRERVFERRSMYRTNDEGVFNDAYADADIDARANAGQGKCQNEYKLDESPDGRNVIDHQGPML